MQGMNKQILTVIVTNEIGVVSHRRVTLQAYHVGVVHIEIHDTCLGLEKFSCKSAYNFVSIQRSPMLISSSS